MIHEIKKGNIYFHPEDIKKGDTYYYPPEWKDLFIEILKANGVKLVYKDTNDIVRHLDSKVDVSFNDLGITVFGALLKWNKGYRVSKLVEQFNHVMYNLADIDLQEYITTRLDKMLEGSPFLFDEVKFSRTRSAHYHFVHPVDGAKVDFYCSKKKLEYRFNYEQKIEISSGCGYEQLWLAGKELERRHKLAQALEKELDCFEFIYDFALV